ncbi:MAG: ribosome biogenesis GTPase YlqF [Corallococcus sp.]|nr:ribosome biogenesis GTPase YlqF [Corallococcus sp.]
MNIQWFPGHMTKALRMMQNNVDLVDVIGYVLDARAPASCLNPAFSGLISGKPCVYILNKCDIADKSKVKQWIDYFAQSDKECVAISAINVGDANKIVSAFGTVTEQIKDKYKSKGIFRPIRAMIIGIPNCGKSTIINCMAGKKNAVTGNKPGVTKGKQWVRLKNGIELLDTPGTVWAKFDDQIVARRLSYIGSIKDDVFDVYELSLHLLEEVQQLYPQSITARYGICDFECSVEKLHEQIAIKRGFVLKGGNIDNERCSKAILDDFRKGKIGAITFELPHEE